MKKGEETELFQKICLEHRISVLEIKDVNDDPTLNLIAFKTSDAYSLFYVGLDFERESIKRKEASQC